MRDARYKVHDTKYKITFETMRMAPVSDPNKYFAVKRSQRIDLPRRLEEQRDKEVLAKTLRRAARLHERQDCSSMQDTEPTPVPNFSTVVSALQHAKKGRPTAWAGVNEVLKEFEVEYLENLLDPYVLECRW